MSAHLKGKKILVVDDEDHIRNVMCRALKAEGCNVTGASSGMEALEKAAMEEFDLALMDIRMPGMNGLETLRKIKSDHPAMGAIMLTGVSDVETTRTAASEAGAFSCLTKPSSLDEVISAIERALNSRGEDI